jgi:two-component system response regulator AtoC
MSTRQDALVRENAALRKALKQRYCFRDLPTRNAAMQSAVNLARASAHGICPVLVVGESGSGKELLARAIHAESPRHRGPFVAVPCAALSEPLLEGELFGHEEGAFAGAVSRRHGKFEAAHGGTLFLDDIGDITPKLQAALLRVIETREFSRVGGSDVVPADVRIIAAASRDLANAVAQGRFRADLYARLGEVTVTLPPLRERREDIPLLVDHLLARISAEHGRQVDGVSREALTMLMTHDFPGNVLELRNMVERAVVCGAGPVLQTADFGLDLLHPPSSPVDASLESVERRHIASVLERTGGNVSQAARILDIDRVTLYSKIRKFGLRQESRA